jgi:hypothetical protein
MHWTIQNNQERQVKEHGFFACLDYISKSYLVEKYEHIEHWIARRQLESSNSHEIEMLDYANPN